MLLVAMPHSRVDGSVISFFVCISLRFQVPVIIGSVISFFVAVGGDEGDGDKGGAIDGLGLDFGEGGEGGEEGGVQMVLVVVVVTVGEGVLDRGLGTHLVLNSGATKRRTNCTWC